MCRTVEQELQLPSRFDKQEIETLLTGDIFRQSTRLIPDKDNIIPICDDDYFDDDITGRFVKWVEAVYGSDTLEETSNSLLMRSAARERPARSSAATS